MGKRSSCTAVSVSVRKLCKFTIVESNDEYLQPVESAARGQVHS